MDKDLLRAFEHFGKVASAKIMMNKDTGKSRGFGFVNFVSPYDAACAVREMNGYQVCGKRLKVQLKKNK